MQLLEIIDYGPNTFGTDEESGGSSENIAKFSVEDAKFHPKRPYRLRTSPGKKGRKKQKKTSAPFFRRKKRFSEKVLCF
jgi:hypothetical protein